MTSAQRKDKILTWFLRIGLVIMGIAIGIAIRHYYNIPIVETINIVEVATLIVTILLAVYIPAVFDRQIQVKQDKKDLIENRIDDLQDFYRKINVLVQQGSNSQKDVMLTKNILDIASNRLTTIIALLENLAVKSTFEKEIRALKALDKKHYELLINNDFTGDNFTYPPHVRDEEELLYNKLDRATSLLVFKISDT